MALDAVLYMMDLWDLTSTERQSPVTVGRCMAAMVSAREGWVSPPVMKVDLRQIPCFAGLQVNMNDRDGGILHGNWSGNYSDGTEPSAWSGSEAILDEYMRTKQPVKYAQCWVFGGTLTTSKHLV